MNPWVIALLVVVAVLVVVFWKKIRAGRSRRYSRKIQCSEFNGTRQHPAEYDLTWEHVRAGVAQDLGQRLEETVLSIDVVKYWHCRDITDKAADGEAPNPETIILQPHCAQDESCVAHEMTHAWVGNYRPLQMKYPGIGRHPRRLFELTAWGNNPQPDPE